jgi:hypothetical protein
MPFSLPRVQKPKLVCNSESTAEGLGLAYEISDDFGAGMTLDGRLY